MLETELRQRMVKEAGKQGCWAASVNDKYISGYPDFRVKSPLYPHLDCELKICRAAVSTLSTDKEIQSGIEKLQFISLRDMNRAGIPAVGLIYIEKFDVYTFTNNKVWVPKQALDAHWIEGKRGKPDFDNLIKQAFYFLSSQGHNYGG